MIATDIICLGIKHAWLQLQGHQPEIFRPEESEIEEYQPDGYQAEEHQ